MTDAPTTFDTTPVTTPAAMTDEEREAEVRAFVDEFWTAYLRCLAELPECDVTRLPDYYTGRALPNRISSIGRYSADGISFRNLENYRVKILGIEFFDSGNSAVVRVCINDQSIQYRPGGNPDGSDLVVDADRSSTLADWEMVKGQDGRWRQEFGDTIDRSVNTEPVCDLG
jgi:hypothetical protein